MDCLFCKIIKGELPCQKVYEDEHIFAFLDIHPVNPGHTLVVPKEHCENILDASPEILFHLISAVKKIAAAALQAVDSQGFNLGVNNGTIAGQVVGHLHFHIMPRFQGDKKQLWTGSDYKEGEAEKIAREIEKLAN